MAEKETNIQLKHALASNETSGINREYIEVMLREDIPILCINRDTQKKRSMPFKALYDNNNRFWLQSGSWEYYITEENLAKIREKTNTRPGIWEFGVRKNNQETPETEKLTAEYGYGKEYNIIAPMTMPEQVKLIEDNHQRLNDLIIKQTNVTEVVAEALVDTTKDAAIVNHVALLNAMQVADSEAKILTQDLVDSTCKMVKSSIQLFSEDIFNDKLMYTLVEKSNGTIVQHMIRVFLNGIAFLSYYNKLVLTSSAINKIRIAFPSRYRNFYHALLPHIPKDDLSLERVFFKGMRAISPELFNHWAVGFLLHDIGKAAAVEYHEGSAAYDRATVIEHVKLGYNSVMHKTNYPREAGLITGYHHEYYGDNTGYGYFRSYLERYKKSNPHAKQDHCIAFELKHMLDFEAHAYFPAKVLEIIDVYDSITDSHRLYHKAMTPEEAITMMREEFINKHLKIDPILFDIFENYIHEKQQICA